MNEETRNTVALLALLALVLVWLGGIVGTLMWAAQPGNAGGVLVTVFVGFVGYGFVAEGWTAINQWAD